MLDTLIAAASRAIQRYCRRDFVSAGYDELHSGRGTRRLLLRHFPILGVDSVRCRPAMVLSINNTDTGTNQQARVAVTATGLALVRVASGVPTTNTLTFAASVTLAALAGAVNALGNGWSATVASGFGNWPAADLRGPQGSLSAWGQNAGLKVHTEELTDYQVDDLRGWLLRPAAEDFWSSGFQNYRVQYTAGYATVPEDVQEACAELVATWFQQRGRDLSLHAESTAGTYSYAAAGGDDLPGRIRALLRPYRHYPLG